MSKFEKEIRELHYQVRCHLPYWHETYPENISRAMLKADDDVMDKMEKLISEMIKQSVEVVK